MYRMSPIQPWLEALDKRPGERTMTDVQYVAELLRGTGAFRDMPHELILELASCAYLEDLEEGVTLFRQGDRGTNWYAVLSGSVSAYSSREGPDKLKQGVEPSCLWSGATFGESVLTDSPRHSTMVTREPCQLVRVEQRDFRKLWQKNKTALKELVQAPSPVTSDRVINNGSSALEERRFSGGSSPAPRRTSSPRVTPREVESPCSPAPRRTSSPRVTPREVVSPCSSCHGTPAARRARPRSPSPQPSPPRRRQLPRSPSPPPPPGSPARQLGSPQELQTVPAAACSPQELQGPQAARSPPAGRQSPPGPRGSPSGAETNGHGLESESQPQPQPQPQPQNGQQLYHKREPEPEPEPGRGQERGQERGEEAEGQERSPSPAGRSSLTPSPEETVPRPRVPHSLLAAQPLVDEPCEELVQVGRTLRTLLLVRCPQLVRDRKYRLHTFRRCMVGTEMVDWLLQLSPSVRSRQQAAAIWQVMLEEGLVSHVTREHPFRDKYLFYRFRDDVDVIGSMNPTSAERREAESQLPSALTTLQRRAPDALIRLILRKPSNQRTCEDLEMVYEELMHIKALSHLTNSVKRELAGVIVFESHLKAGTVLFHQGDEGQSWYIILRGSVNVVIHGKGTVTTLNDGDDFGNLALINDAPRAATIVCREDSCFFLRVDKEDFNRILRDVEANTVRLKEHGKDVLVLEKLAEPGSTAQFKYSVMAGTPQKMLEHLLETRFGGFSETRASEITISDLFLDDFLLTHVIFFPFKELTEELINKYRACQESNPDGEYVLACKRRVIRFLHQWASTIREPVLEDLSGLNSSFLEDLYHLVEADATTYGPLFREETHLMMDLMEMREKAHQERHAYGVRKWKMPSEGHRVTLFSGNSVDEEVADRVRPMQHHDEMIFRVYCADHTFCTLKFPLSATAAAIRRSAADKLGLNNDDLMLVQLKSSGERVPLRDSVTSVTTGLSLNGRLFVSPKDHLDALTPLPEQEGPTESSCFDIEGYNTRDLAVVMTQLDWEAFNKIHEYEILYHVTGREQQGRTTANLDVFLCRFTEYQHWVITETCLCANLNRRVALLKKFIKLATACRELKNLNAFFAIVMGLSNTAVSRLTQTWEKLPSKFRKMYAAFEVLIDPTRNHRAYRVYMADLLPPIVPFMPLLIKDMTFTHDGNPTRINGLINFEKMHMLAQTMRTLRYCRSRPLDTDVDQMSRVEFEIRRHLRSLYVIDNQKILNSLSQKLESRRT